MCVIMKVYVCIMCKILVFKILLLAVLFNLMYEL